MHKIIILDFGGQYCHLIARRIRDLGVYAEVILAGTRATAIKKDMSARGIILSGGAMSVYDKTAPRYDRQIFKLNLPILGICYGHQIIARLHKGTVKSAKVGEYGLTNLKVTAGKLTKKLKKQEKVWMNHRDVVTGLPAQYIISGQTKHSPVAIFENDEQKIYGVQFHPEVTHTPCGKQIFKNFVFDICQSKKGWNTAGLAQSIIKEAKTVIGNQKAIVGLSGGIDSTVAAFLTDKAIGRNLQAVYVDTGLMRQGESEFIRKNFSHLNLKIAHESAHFFKVLANITSPERKRKIIGKLFVDIFNQYAKKFGATILIQGTIYSDRIESGATEHAANIKSHHNVGGLPKKMKLQVYEPLRDLYKDEVRNLAGELKIPRELITRHVFPGPGIAIRIIGKVTPVKARIVRRATHIVEQELKIAKLYDKIWMSFTVLLPIKSVGIQGDARSYKYPMALRIIESRDVMTANFAHLPYKILEKISTRITNEIKEVNRVVYDISNKPPATMEWE